MPTSEQQKPNETLLRAFGHMVQRAAKPEAEKATVGDDDRTFDFVLSTNAVDSYGEVCDAGSWRLDRFEANPIALYQHDRGQGFSLGAQPYPIGYWSNVRVEGDQLLGTLNVSRATEQAETVYKLLKEGTLRACSVGFMPGRIEDEIDSKGRVVKTTLYDCELFECSVVMVPANPEAVALSRTKTIAELRARSAAPAPSSAAETSMGKQNQAAAAADANSIETKSDATSAPTTEATAPATEAKADPAMPAETPTDQPKPLENACRECMDACAKCDAAATKCAELAEQAEGDLEALGDECAEECREASAAAKMAMAGCEMLMKAMADGDADAAGKALGELKAKRLAVRGIEGTVVELQPDPIRVLVLDTLGLPTEATVADVSKAIAGLSVKSGRADDIEPRLRVLEAELAKRDAADADREVNWLVKRSADYQLGIKDDTRTRKALAAYRKADPKGFAEDYKAALDGLKAFDRHETFEPITHGAGAALQTPETLASKPEASSNDDLERHATELQEKAAKAGKPISRSEALERAILGG